MPPAARLTDTHACPVHPPNPVAGPCSPNVIIGGLPAARVTDLCTCQPPNPIVSGSRSVFINGLPAARIGDPTAHGGRIVIGCPTVIIGDQTYTIDLPSLGNAAKPCMKKAKALGLPFIKTVL